MTTETYRAELLETLRYALGRTDNTVYSDDAMEKAIDYIARQAAVIARVEALADEFDKSAAYWSDRTGDSDGYGQGRCNSFCEAEARLRAALKGDSNDN